MFFRRLALLIVLSLVFLILLNTTPIHAQEITPTLTETPTITPTATPDFMVVTLTLFLDANSLTLYVHPSALPASLATLSFQVAQGSTNQTYRLEEYSGFLGMPFHALPTPICFRLVRSGTSSPVPGVCQGLRLMLVQPVANADVFWFDPLTGEARLVMVYVDSTFTGICQTTLAGCELEVRIPLQPTPTPTPSLSPTSSEETLTATPTNSSSATQMTASYPCEGTINGTPGVQLNQVKAIPTRNAPPRPAVQGGATVRIENRQANEGILWYQISYSNNVGWIPAQYMTPLASCPA